MDGLRFACIVGIESESDMVGISCDATLILCKDISLISSALSRSTNTFRLSWAEKGLEKVMMASP